MMVEKVQKLKRGGSAGWAPPLDVPDCALDDILYVEKTGALAFGSIAQNILEGYCWQLPGSSGAGLLQPYYSYETRPGLGGREWYLATVYLPSNCPVSAIPGDWQTKKDTARQSACLEALRSLHAAGALDDYLEPAFTRSGRMRSEMEGDTLLHRKLPRVLLTHRLPAALLPGASGGSSPAVATAGSVDPIGPGVAGPGAACASVSGPSATLRHLYTFSFSRQQDPVLDMKADAAVGNGGGRGDRIHPFGLMLHRKLPYELPAFTVRLQEDEEGDKDMDAGSPGAAAVTTGSSWARVQYVGPVQLNGPQLAALVAADRVMEAWMTRGDGGALDSVSCGGGGSSPEVDWRALEALARGPVPLSELLPGRLAPLVWGTGAAVTAADCPLDSDDTVSGGTASPDAGFGAGAGDGTGYGRTGCAALRTPSAEEVADSLGPLLRSHGLLVALTDGGLYVYRGMERGLTPDSPMEAGGDGTTFGARLASRWGVNAASIQRDQPLVRMGAAATGSNILARGDASASTSAGGPRPDPLGQGPNPDAGDSGSRKGSRQGQGQGGGTLLLPQALALAPLPLRLWRAAAQTVELAYRLEALAAAEEARQRLLTPLGFLELASPAVGTGSIAGRCGPGNVATQLAMAAAGGPAAQLAGAASAAVLGSDATSLALAALSSKSAADPQYDCERLEFLGDAVIKFFATLYVYGKERDKAFAHEGVMSHRRDRLVANEVLLELGTRLGLQDYIRAAPYSLRSSLRLRRVGLRLQDDGEAGAADTPVGGVNAGGVEAAGAAAVEADVRREQEVRGKRVADCVEALVGAHLAAGMQAAAPAHAPGASAAAVRLLPAEGDDTMSTAGGAFSLEVMKHLESALRFCIGAGILEGDAARVLDGLHSSPRSGGGQPVRGAKAAEATIAAAEAVTEHAFAQPGFAVAALTHVSFPTREAGCHYQLLEFLGDAVLGLVVSVWVFRHGGTPEQMTAQREKLVSNEALAAAALAAGLPTAVRMKQRQLQADVQAYALAMAPATTVAARSANAGDDPAQSSGGSADDVRRPCRVRAGGKPDARRHRRPASRAWGGSVPVEGGFGGSSGYRDSHGLILGS
ncbi:hypothetical protein GPECTOR_17g970 [Gonium pectorale]|uniref:Uncharacterized protein n=1 Tax=Gonium pectorale TaxID=33097 RepID=A0A150GKF9_GONPE|nr:hypothetical protein GPECTOR_17g970 [Gonium pectorale]|eukprot:KXZ50329.1 hypothetical protein GPECTOR_17g970 [Gonium pectorale]